MAWYQNLNLQKKLILSCAFLLLLVLTVCYYVVVQRAETLLQDFVESQSQGKMQLHLEKVKLNLFKLRFEMDEPEFRTNDSSNTVTGYHIKAQMISFRVKSVLPILFKQPVGIDSLIVKSPVIEVFKCLEVKSEKISLPDEMGKVYQSMENILSLLYLEFLHISNAKFIVYNRFKPDSKPLSVSNLHLTINKVNNQVGISGDRFLYSDRILFEIFNQNIELPDGYHGIKFKRFRLNTGSQTIKLDSCTVYGKKSINSNGEFHSFLDSIRIYKFDFNALVNKNILKMDSAVCMHPEVDIVLPLGMKNGHKGDLKEILLHQDSLDVMLKKMLGNLEIGYLAVREAKVHVETVKDGKSNTFDLNRSHFSIEKLLVNNDPHIPIQLARFKLQLQNYTGYTADSMYVIGFDEVQVVDKKISLMNFRLEPTSKNHEKQGREIRMAAFEFNDIEWPVLLYENRIVAGRMILIKPQLHLNLPANKPKPAAAPSFHLDMLSDFRQKIDVAGISVEDGSIQLDGKNGLHIAVDHLYAGIDVKQLLLSNSIFQTVDALDTLAFADGEFRNKVVRIKFSEGKYTKIGKVLKIKNLTQSKSDKSLTINLQNLVISGISVHSGNIYALSGLEWGSGEVIVNPTGISSKRSELALNQKMPEILIGKISGGTTKLTYRGANLEASTIVNHISTDKVEIIKGKKPVVQGLMVDGQSFSLQQNKLKGSFSGFQIQDSKRSTIDNVEIKMPFNQELVTFQVPKLIFSVNIAESVKGNLLADFIEMQTPSISFQLQTSFSKSDSGKVKGKFPLLNIKNLKIDQPKFLNFPAAINQKMMVDPGRANFNFVGINSDSSHIHLDSLQLTLIQPLFSNNQLHLIPTGKEYLGLSASDFNFRPAVIGKKAEWSFNLDAMKTTGLHFNVMHGDTIHQTIGVNKLNLQHLVLSSQSVEDKNLIINQNRRFHLSAGNLYLDNGKTRLESYNLMLDRGSNSLSLDSMAFLQLLDRDTFLKDKIYRTSYMHLFTGQIMVKGIAVNRLINEQVFEAKRANVSDLRFVNFIDKRLPMQHGIEKPILTELLTRIKAKIAVDSLVLKNGRIEAEEVNDKTLQTGLITLTKIRGGVTGIRNFDFKKADSLKFNLYAKLLDTAQIRVNYSQSYTDTLYSFHLKAIVNSFDLTALNPMLKPFASAQVNSGYLDTLRMSVVGRKHVAFGTMKMFYHDLHVEYLNKGVDTHPTFKTRMISFFANRIVHNKNQMGSGDVYAERDPEKGFVNYWVKIFIGGVFTNTGVRTDKKQIKKYTKSIKKYQVPPIPNIPVDF